MSRFHRVVARTGERSILVADSRGAVHRASLLALDGPPPEPGDWVVVHSGYALERVDRGEAEAVQREMEGSAGTGERP